MNQQLFTKPFYIFFLVLPYGISIGFVTVTMPYVLTNKGFSVAEVAGIVSLGLSANIWRFFWGPLADLSLSLKKWYWIGVTACVSTLLLLCFIPFKIQNITLITGVVFLSQVAATFVVLPVGGIMAKRIEENKKGSAGGWYQAGNLGGMGLGGGAGLWLTTHYNVALAGVVLGLGSLLCALFVIFIKDVYSEKNENIFVSLNVMLKDVVSMLRIPIVIFVMLLFCMPIGTGAASNLWSSIAADWKADADTVALVTGILSGIISAIGCVIGGFIADKFGNWWAYLGAGFLCALITILMALLPYHPMTYVAGVLAYAFVLGLINAAFTSLALYATGKKAAATKYSLLSSIANIPVVYMTAFDGWAHDLKGSKYMLVTEALAAVVFIALSIVVLKKMSQRNLVPAGIE